MIGPLRLKEHNNIGQKRFIDHVPIYNFCIGLIMITVQQTISLEHIFLVSEEQRYIVLNLSEQTYAGARFHDLNQKLVSDVIFLTRNKTA